MKKPSEIINKYTNQHLGHDVSFYPDPFQQATMQYLDEERERVDGILHEIVSALHDGSFDTQNCNYLHHMIDGTLSENKL